MAHHQLNCYYGQESTKRQGDKKKTREKEKGRGEGVQRKAGRYIEESTVSSVHSYQRCIMRVIARKGWGLVGSEGRKDISPEDRSCSTSECSHHVADKEMMMMTFQKMMRKQ